MADETKSIIEQIDAIKDTAEFKTLVENTSKASYEKNIDAKVKEIYDSVDVVLSEVLGTNKPNGTKTTEYLKNQLTTLKESKATPNPKIDDAMKEKEALWNQTKTQFQAELEARDSQIKSLKQQGIEQSVSAKIDAALVGKIFNAAYGKEELSDLVDIRKKRLIQNSKLTDEGKVIYYKDKEKTQPYLNTIGDPLDSQSVADLIFSSLYQTQKKGGDADLKDLATTQGAEVVNIDMSKISSQTEFYVALEKALSLKGLANYQEEYIKKQKATSEFYKIKDLKL